MWTKARIMTVSIYQQTDIERSPDSTVYYSGQWTEFLNNILKLDLTFKFSTVSYLNICALHIIGKTLLWGSTDNLVKDYKCISAKDKWFPVYVSILYDKISIVSK